MTKAPRSKSNVNQPNQLLEALTFCNVVCERVGQSYETHIRLKDNRAVAYNGVIAACAPIVEDIVCYPHTSLLIEALKKCDDNYTLTQLDNSRLSVKSGKFKAIVPCLDPALAQQADADPMIVGITNKFKEAVEAVGVLANEDADHVLTSSVLMNGPSVISTNRVMLLEFWHGLNLPPHMPLPKQFVSCLVKIKRNLIGFGLSNCTATFHFEGDYWLRTQLYSDKWPDVSKILDRKANLWSIDTGVWKALDAVAPFSEDGNVYSELNLLKSHADEQGASYECAGIPRGFVYPIKQLQIIKPYVRKIDWMASGVHDSSYCCVFEGDEMRGVISGRQRQ